MACQHHDGSIKAKSFAPGAARYGNFINYYTFNSVSERLKALPLDLTSKLVMKNNVIVCLDIGCNSGEMTVGLYSHLMSNSDGKSQIFVLGIDLDRILITRCNESNLYQNNITFQQLDIMTDSAIIELKLFLKEYNRSEFDLITCFSTTMWIHLNHGDEGLENFLRNISSISRYLVIEPQEWKSYKSAVRRMTRLNCELFALDKFKTRDIVQHISKFLSEECNTDLYKCYGETTWGRKLYLFKKRCMSNF